MKEEGLYFMPTVEIIERQIPLSFKAKRLLRGCLNQLNEEDYEFLYDEIYKAVFKDGFEGKIIPNSSLKNKKACKNRL